MRKTCGYRVNRYVCGKCRDLEVIPGRRGQPHISPNGDPAGRKSSMLGKETVGAPKLGELTEEAAHETHGAV